MTEKKRLKNDRIQKVVKKPKKVTQSGLISTSSIERTLQLNEETRKRSARIERVFEHIGIKSIQEKSNFTNIPLGAMGRMSRSHTCPKTLDCWKVCEASFSNKGNRHLIYPSYTLGNRNAPHPQKLEEDDLIKLLQDMFATYNDSATSRLTGLIPQNNSGTEEDEKQFINILLQIDLFKMSDSRARIAYPSDPHSGLSSSIIAGYIEVNEMSEISNLNGQECIIVPKQGAAPLLRRIHIINKHILCTSLSNGAEGALILNLDNNNRPYSIGRIELIIANRHINLTKKMSDYENSSELDRSTESSFNNENDNSYDEEIFIIK